MHIQLDAQLKRLRREKGNTQEELAQHLGITMQAVSKWERGEGYPDITLLPAIAAYYRVSIDDLLGVGAIEREKKLRAYRERHMELYRAGKNAERVALWREALAEFPGDLSVIYELMYALQAEDRVGNADEVIAYGEQILEESNNNAQRNGAIQSLCFTYYDAKGDVESAKKYAKMEGIYHTTVNQLMPRLLEGEEAIEYCQSNIQSLVDLIAINTNVILWKGKYSPEETIRACRFVLDCYELLYVDGNCGFYHCRLAEFYGRMAQNYGKLGRAEEMFDALEQAARHAVRADTYEDGMYTAFMVNRVKLSSIEGVKDYTANESGLLQKSLGKACYTPWREDPRMRDIVRKLEPVAFMG